MRNLTGFMIGQTRITPVNILFHLAMLPGLSEEKARQLLKPSNKKNAPKAVALLQELLKLPVEDSSLTPSQAHIRRIIAFFARILNYFAPPFIDASMDLSTRIRHLSVFAHSEAVIQLQHGTHVWTVTRMQLVSDALQFHIILEGKDRLEQLFLRSPNPGSCSECRH